MNTDEIEAWNRRALWCVSNIDVGHDSLVARAEHCLEQWRALRHTLRGVSRELRAAAHQGLHAGPARDAVESHREGCLTLCSMVGGGKTTAAAWMAYRAAGPVLWLDAARVAISRTGTIERWMDEIRVASFVMVDDVGAAGTIGQYESPKVAVILTAVAARAKPSIISTNLGREAFGRAYDAAQGGRLIDRLTMAPNRWLDMPDEPESRRAHAVPPPDEEVLPKRERRAADFLRAVQAARRAGQATVMADVDQQAIRLVADRLGKATLAEVDQAVADYEEGQRRLTSYMEEWELRSRSPVLADVDTGAEQRRRVALMDLVTNVADRHGKTEAEILEGLGRTRRTLSDADEPRLLAMLAEPC